MELKNHKTLANICSNANQERLLFTFNFNAFEFKCLYFQNTNTFLISHPDKDCAYMFSLDEKGKFNGKLPREFYYAIRETLIKETGNQTIKQIWESLDERIATLSVSDIEQISDREVIKHLGQTKTSDKSYDKEGDMPFFKTWRRNSKKSRVSYENLSKTERLYGKEVRDQCYKENISSIWSDIPSEKSLDFISKDRNDI